MSSHFSLGHTSLTGDRSMNQDRWCAHELDGILLLGLADGMGGHPRGEEAAQILIDNCEQLLAETGKPLEDPGGFLLELLAITHRDIQHYGSLQIPAIDPRTTAVLAIVQENTVHWTHAGDSRFYLFRDGCMLTRSRDHSYVERLLQQGVIEQWQLETHPQRNYVTHCLGGAHELQSTSVERHDLQDGDVLLLCSDGLWSGVDEQLMADALYSAMNLPKATRALAEEAAHSAFPHSDNVTLVACRIGDQIPSKKEPPESAVTKNNQQRRSLDCAINDLQQAIERLEQDKQQEKS